MKMDFLLMLFTTALISIGHLYVLGQKISNDCFRHTDLLDPTLDSFISLVEKVENHNPHWNIYEVSEAIFRLYFGEQVHDVDYTKQQIQRVIISELLGSDDNLKIKEDTLTEKETCSMFFMMEHSVKKTYRILRPIPVKKTYYYEQGVIKTSEERGQTVATNIVLLGILASQYKHGINLEELFGTQDAEFYDVRYIEALYLVTLGAVLPPAAIHHKEGSIGMDYFGSRGRWDSTHHPKKLLFEENPSGSTNALLLGAVDGLLIGTSLQTLLTTEGIKLSTVLRNFYSMDGIIGIHDDSHCKRLESLNKLNQKKLEETFKTLYKLNLFKKQDLASDADKKYLETHGHLLQALDMVTKTLHASTACRHRREFVDANCPDPALSQLCHKNFNFYDKDLHHESRTYRDCLNRSGCPEYLQDMAVHQLFGSSSDTRNSCDVVKVSLSILILLALFWLSY